MTMPRYRSNHLSMDGDCKCRPVESTKKTMSDYEIRFERNPRRVRVEFNGTWIADSRRALVLHETRQPPSYYFPREDVKVELLRKTQHVTHCPFKGNASYWSVDA